MRVAGSTTWLALVLAIDAWAVASWFWAAVIACWSFIAVACWVFWALVNAVWSVVTSWPSLCTFCWSATILAWSPASFSASAAWSAASVPLSFVQSVALLPHAPLWLLMSVVIFCW